MLTRSPSEGVRYPPAAAAALMAADRGLFLPADSCMGAGVGGFVACLRFRASL